MCVNYVLHLRIDQYGQILNCNWPKKGYSDRTQLKSVSELEKFALKAALRKGFNLNQYKKSLFFNENLEKMCWIFQFQKQGNDENGLYNEFEVDWKKPRNRREEYERQKHTVY